MNLKIILFSFVLAIFFGCHEGSDQIQRHRDVDIEREEDYNNQKNPTHTGDEIKK